MSDRNYVIVRTESAGCFAGELVSREGSEARMTNARRLWYWSGAASLSGLAIHGTTNPIGCKFPAPVDVTLLGVVEVIDVTPAAQKSISEVPEWKA